MKNKLSPAGGKLPAYFAITVLNKETGKMLDYKKLINHPNKQTQEWWQKSPANEFGRLLKRVGINDDGTQRVKGSNTINFI